MNRRRALSAWTIAPVMALALSGCGERPQPTASVATPPVSAAISTAPSYAGPVLGPTGECEGQAPTTAAAIEPGIGECELVRLKGAPPTDVLVGESGRGQREVQVLYAEATGRELYFFVNNRLDRVLR